MRRYIFLACLALILVLNCISGDSFAAGHEQELTPDEVASMSIEELMNLEVTTASKKPVKRFKTPAAVYVLSGDDIRRSGATTIPDALRLVPGLHVARLDGNKPAVTIRGFQERFSSRMLVLIDGRAVYSPLFSGVYWDVQDMVFEDIDRIEVIRGPGGSLWGTNAVNGIINIITKKASKTRGIYASAGAGNVEKGLFQAQYGGGGEKTSYRFYGKTRQEGKHLDPDGTRHSDSSRLDFGGFRSDTSISDAAALMLKGEAYRGKVGTTTINHGRRSDYETKVSGGNITGAYNRELDGGSTLELLFYYDRTERHNVKFGENRDTYDLDFHHKFRAAELHELVWGLESRYTRDVTVSTGATKFSPPSKGTGLYTAFLQDSIAMTENLEITAGSKFEQNPYSGLEFQPSVRAGYTPGGPDSGHFAWAAISRAVRTPSRAYQDMMIQVNLPTGPFDVLVPNKDFKSDVLIAYEAGYRFISERDFSFDLALFYNEYSNLETHETINEFGTTRMINMGSGTVFGAELSLDYTPVHWWRLTLNYSAIGMSFRDTKSEIYDCICENAQGSYPKNMIVARSLMSLPYRTELDLTGYYMDKLPRRKVKSYTRFDARLGWRPVEWLGLSLLASNIGTPRHQEFYVGDYSARTEFEPEYFAQIEIKY